MSAKEQAEQLAIDAVTKFTVPFDEVCVRVRKDIILSTIPLVELLECVEKLRIVSDQLRALGFKEEGEAETLRRLDAKLKGKL